MAMLREDRGVISDAALRAEANRRLLWVSFATI